MDILIFVQNLEYWFLKSTVFIKVKKNSLTPCCYTQREVFSASMKQVFNKIAEPPLVRHTWAILQRIKHWHQDANKCNNNVAVLEFCNNCHWMVKYKHTNLKKKGINEQVNDQTKWSYNNWSKNYIAKSNYATGFQFCLEHPASIIKAAVDLVSNFVFNFVLVEY